MERRGHHRSAMPMYSQMYGTSRPVAVISPIIPNVRYWYANVSLSFRLGHATTYRCSIFPATCDRIGLMDLNLPEASSFFRVIQK